VIQDPGINMPRKKGRSQRKKAIRAKNRVQNQAAALYERLDSKRREIRIAKLNAGDFSDDIHCTLFKVSLDDNPQYEALSYVWGDTGVTRQISLNGSPYQVTESLEIALRHLRLPSEDRILWVDAICINQRDVPERNVQVRHMGSVYETASKVIAWLGEESGDSNLAFDAFEALPKDKELHWDPEKNQHFEDKFLQREYVSAMKQILRRPWWHRLWTAQESILGPVLEFTCGHRCISAEPLFALANSWFIHRRFCCSGYLWKNSGLNRFSDSMLFIDDLRSDRQEKSGHELLYLLASHRSRECADPRDKIYGLLGLCPDHEKSSIIPDYSAPISRVYEDVTLNIIEKHGSLDIFGHICSRIFGGFELWRNINPSWVPNWAAEDTYPVGPLRRLEIRQRQIKHYRASSGAIISLKHLQRGRISLRGVFCGAIALLGSPIIPESSGVINWKALLKEWRDLAEIENFPNRPYAAKTSTTCYNAYWQTLCCSLLPLRSIPQNFGLVNSFKRTLENMEYRSWHEAWWDWIMRFDANLSHLDSVSSHYTGAEIHAFDSQVYKSVNMRRLLVSDNDRWLGLAPMDAQVGDKIVLLGGGKVPYILRPKDGAETGYYELIGDAYVHGIMDGEAWNPELLEEIVLV
jgi:hypothetical protein